MSAPQPSEAMRHTGVDPEEFLATVPDRRRREEADTVMRIMADVSGERPVMWGPSIIGFGRHHYRYASGREGVTPVIGLSPRRQALTLYGVWEEPDPNPRIADLGPHRTGKGCLYIPHLDRVDLGVLRELIREGWRRHAAGS